MAHSRGRHTVAAAVGRNGGMTGCHKVAVAGNLGGRRSDSSMSDVETSSAASSSGGLL